MATGGLTVVKVTAAVTLDAATHVTKEKGRCRVLKENAAVKVILFNQNYRLAQILLKPHYTHTLHVI